MKNFEKYTASVDISIRDAVKQMDLNKIETQIVEHDGRIVGIFTIGDFRRGVLKGLDINSDLSGVINRDYIYLKEHYSEELARKIFVNNELISDLPVLNESGQLLDIIRRHDVLTSDELNSNNYIDDVPVVIMAGGKGKRMDPFTRVLPKPLIPLGDDPVIKVIMDNFANYKVSKFYVSVNDKEWMVKAYFHDNQLPYQISYIMENKPLGTAGALKQMLEEDADNIFVSNCDVIINADYASIYNHHIESGLDMTMVGCVRKYTIPYGVFSVSADGGFVSMKEKPEYDYLVNTGLYVINRNILKLIPEDTYYDMNSLIDEAMKKGMKIGVFPVSDASWMDVGQWNEYSKTLHTFGG